MNLQQQLRAEGRLFQTSVQPDHRDLDQVGRRTLNHRVDRDPLRHRALPMLLALHRVAHTLNAAATAKRGRHIALFPTLIQDAFHEHFDARITREIGVNELGRLTLGNA